MLIPNLTSEGFLPEGIHDCSLEELRKQFGSFQLSDRRPHLYRRLEEFVQALRNLHTSCFLLVNGSFVSSEPRPNDIDLILVLPREWDLHADLEPAAYNLMSKAAVRRTWGFDLLVARDGTMEYFKYVSFFQRVRYRRNARKGILRIKI
jgi:hypothetical protein